MKTKTALIASIKKIITSLNTTQGQLSIIIGFLCAGFWAGCYYKETIMIRSQIKEREEWFSNWHKQEDQYREEIFNLRREIINLEKDKLKSSLD